jgi:hypothetical protein
MHHTNGVLEDSGKHDGKSQPAQSRDRVLRPSGLPEYSELYQRSEALREKLFGPPGGSGRATHYIRTGHACDNCPEKFSSKAKLRAHRFEKHSY